LKKQRIYVSGKLLPFHSLVTLSNIPNFLRTASTAGYYNCLFPPASDEVFLKFGQSLKILTFPAENQMRTPECALTCCLTWLLLIAVLCSVNAASPADKETYEKLGLSETEWSEILEMRLSLPKVHQLLESGVSIAEYHRRPWLKLSITEPEYVRLRRSGLSDADVRLSSTRATQAGGWTTAGSFLLPGVSQVCAGRNVPGWIMAAIALGCAGLCAGMTQHSHAFQPLGLFLLAPDMLWSGIDAGIQVGR